MWLLLTPALACLWDSDTLAVELAGLPGVEAVAYGDFDRLPAEYYQVRLLRVESAMSAGRATPEDYDDGAVAADRLGLHDLAIDWMRAKADLPGLDTEQRYRTEANLGTFYAHRGLALGGPEGRADLARAVRHLDAALALNPDAHFGREQVQRDLVAWLASLEPPAEGERPALRTYLDASRRDDLRIDDENTEQLHDVIEGLRGLVVLGAAWESVDVMATLARALEGEGRNHAARLVSLRAQELARSGHRSLQPGLPKGEALVHHLESGIGLFEREEERLEAIYADGRSQADRRSAERLRAIHRRLRDGRHPDTDPAFWGPSLPAVRPPMPDPPSADTARGCGCATAAGALWAVPWWLLGRRRRRGFPTGTAAPE